MKQSQSNRGIISLTVVIFMMVIMVLILALLQSRILLGIQRTKGAADSILSTYNAESEIYDTLARFQKGAPIANKPEETLNDGTKLRVDTENLANEQEITITAKLPYATTKLTMSRASSSTTSFNGVDLVLSLDCTGSMSSCADPEVAAQHPFDNNYCLNSSNPAETTRFQELRKATVAFLEGLKGITEVPVRVGISVFSGDSDWARTSAGTSQPGVEIRPDNNLSIDDLIKTINTDFNAKKPSSSTGGCKVIPEEGTSHASSLQFMQNYLTTSKLTTIKQVEVMVTDGLPTTAIPAPMCGNEYQYFIPTHTTIRCDSGVPFIPHLDPFSFWRCEQNGTGYTVGTVGNVPTELTACMITGNDRTWGDNRTGQRDPNLDAYVIITSKQDDNDPFKLIMTKQPGVFYYDTDNAQDLTTILKNDVIKNITKTVNEFKIRRVAP